MAEATELRQSFEVMKWSFEELKERGELGKC
jgi:hypothetical protein